MTSRSVEEAKKGVLGRLGKESDGLFYSPRLRAPDDFIDEVCDTVDAAGLHWTEAFAKRLLPLRRRFAFRV